LMVAFVFVLMAPAIMTGLIASNRKVMGQHTSTGIWKIAYWTCLLVILSFGIMALATHS
jgi:Mn2+/Fe2+ NRAMP family transporter